MKKLVLFLIFSALTMSCQRNRITDAVGGDNFYNYPNPFSEKTTVRYIANRDTYVSISIYTTIGESVKNLVTGQFASANQVYETEWDGSNSGGSQVASGTYIGLLEADGGNRKIKISRIR